jgi:beta-lactamase superfamily II metal-dependent hydrolase
MEIRIFDVAHGFCAMIASPSGGLAVIDCGHDSEGFRPSEFLRANGRTEIHHLVISNYDQDHVSDLHNVRRLVNVHVFHQNRSLTPDYLIAQKLQSGPLTDAMRSAIQLAADYIHPVTNPPNMGGVEITTFSNQYPEFLDTNNLSVVTFVTFDGFKIIFPGDLEAAGWRALLRNPIFCAQLAVVNVFVASHHGRESGYCADVFQHCSPDIVVISDKEIVHATQQHNYYAQHVPGLVASGGQARKVFTTRNDGTIQILKPVGRPYTVNLNVR